MLGTSTHSSSYLTGELTRYRSYTCVHCSSRRWLEKMPRQTARGEGVYATRRFVFSSTSLPRTNTTAGEAYTFHNKNNGSANATSEPSLA